MSERMIFCIGGGKYESKGEGYQKNNRVFNVQLTEDEFNKIKSNLPIIKLPLTKWIEEKDMTQKEKDNNSSYKNLGGYLRVNSYKNAWKEFWNNANEVMKAEIKAIPYFNEEIFEKITGIKMQEEVVEMTVAEISKALGKNVKIVK